jgi:two-component system NtrC family sensor kinase
VHDKDQVTARLARELDQAQETRIELESKVRELTEQTVVLKEHIRQHQMEDAKLINAHRVESVGHLAAGLAHEINSPLQYLGDVANYLKDVFPDLFIAYKEIEEIIEKNSHLSLEQKDEILKDIELVQAEANIPFLSTQILQSLEDASQCIGRVSSLIKSMQSFAAPGIGYVQFTNIEKSIEDIVTISRNEWNLNAKVVLDFEEGFPEIPIFRGEFNQAILNLIINASQAIHELQDSLSDGAKTHPGKILIKGWVDKANEHRAIIEIQDNGIGISENIQDKIFDPYFTTHEVGSGLGMGLAIARDIIVEKHKGELTFKTAQGQGTIFRMTLMTHVGEFPKEYHVEAFKESIGA